MLLITLQLHVITSALGDVPWELAAPFLLEKVLQAIGNHLVPVVAL